MTFFSKVCDRKDGQSLEAGIFCKDLLKDQKVATKTSEKVIKFFLFAIVRRYCICRSRHGFKKDKARDKERTEKSYVWSQIFQLIFEHPDLLFSNSLNIQSNSVITNFMGPAKFVCYNRGSL